MHSYLPRLSEPARRWTRFVALIAALGLLCWLAYSLRQVLTPLLVALAIAYIANPVVTWFERVRQVPRLVTVVLVFVVLGSTVLGGGMYVGSMTVAQIQQFGQKIPGYRQSLEKWLAEYQARLAEHAATAPAATTGSESGDEAPAATSQATSQATALRPSAWLKRVTPLVETHGVAVATSTANYLIGATMSIANLATLLVLIPMYTFFFLWRFDDIVRTVHDHLPAASRDAITHVVKTVDEAVANFFRGRLIVCMIVGAVTGLGWTIVGVPYSLPLGAVAGLLNLVPFMSILALPPALVCTYLASSEAHVGWAMPATLTLGVYLGVQALESFLLSPAIEGRSSGLHPLAIVVALLIGGQIAGLLGMLLAIPMASTLKTLSAEFVWPEVRRLAGQPVAARAEPPPGRVRRYPGPARSRRNRRRLDRFVRRRGSARQ